MRVSGPAALSGVKHYCLPLSCVSVRASHSLVRNTEGGSSFSRGDLHVESCQDERLPVMKNLIVGCLLLSGCLIVSNSLGGKVPEEFSANPNGQFESGGVTWLYYICSNLNYAVVWPMSEVGDCLVVPDSVEGYPVGDCYELAGRVEGWSLDLPGSVRAIDFGIFAGNEALASLTNLCVRDDTSTETVLCHSLFLYNDRLRSVCLGEGVVEIGQECFANATNLEVVTLPKTLRRICWGAFGRMDVYYPNLPEVDAFEMDEFGNFYIGDWLIIGTNPSKIRAGTVGLADEAFWYGRQDELILPDGIVYIGSMCCETMPNRIPDSVKFIGSWAFGGPSFGCGDTTIRYFDGWCFGPADVAAWSQDDELVRSFRMDEEMYSGEDWYEEMKKESWWQEMKNLSDAFEVEKEKLVIAEGTKGIVSDAFNASGWGDNYTLKHVELPESLKYICDSAFERCFSLQSISFPSNLEWIGKYAFSQCQSLKEVHLGPRVARFSEGVFFDTFDLKEVYTWAGYFDYDSLLSPSFYFSRPAEREMYKDIIGQYTKNIHLYSPLKFVSQSAWGYVNLIFEEGVTDIGKIIGGEGTGEIVIPSTVTNIADNAFDACPTLSNIVIKIVNSSDVKFSGQVFSKKYQIKVVALPYNAKGYDDLIAQLGADKVKFTVGTESGFGQWVLVNGLAGQGSAADFDGKSGGNKYENGFLYIFGNEIENEAVQLIQLERAKDGGIAFRLPETEHEDKVKVVGTANLNDWDNAIELKKDGDVWVLPDGTKPPDSFFCRVIITE